MSCCCSSNYQWGCGTGSIVGCLCGSCAAAMSTAKPTPGICQSNCGKNTSRGSAISCALNAVGKIGSTMLAIAQNKPVVTCQKTGKVTIGTTGQSVASLNSNPVMILLLLVAVGAVIFFVARG